VITLVLGGARSGKSTVAERLAAEAAGDGAVTYLATGAASDPEMAARIAEHRARRPAAWRTVETGPDLVGALRECRGVALVDALGTWLAALDGMEPDRIALCDAVTGRAGDTVVVSEEVGLGVHPATDVGRRFRDQLGLLNQTVAAVADRALLVVAGRVLRLEELAAVTTAER
jgi:adenosyl cobinamide kinase/adenosyl cobinamide phosphate guanylyltransferase